MKKLFYQDGIDYEMQVQLNSTGRFHRVVCAGSGFHEEKLCSTRELEEVCSRMELEARCSTRGYNPIAILKSIGFE